MAMTARVEGGPMASGQDGTNPLPPGVLAGSWQAAVVLGALTLILGLIVSLHPSGSVNVIAVLLGVLAILSGIFNLIRVFDPNEAHRVWQGIAGLLIIGITWIVQGLAALIGGISGGVREGRAWWIIFGAASIIAGIAVTATPASSLNVLATLLGIWFMVMGVFEIIGGLLLRHAIRHAEELTHA